MHLLSWRVLGFGRACILQSYDSGSTFDLAAHRAWFGLDKTLPFYRLLLFLFFLSLFCIVNGIFLLVLGFVCDGTDFWGFLGGLLHKP